MPWAEISFVPRKYSRKKIINKIMNKKNMRKKNIQEDFYDSREKYPSRKHLGIIFMT